MAAFFVEGVVWAFPTSYGVLLSAYMRDPTFNVQKDALEVLSQIGSVSSGIMYISSSSRVSPPYLRAKSTDRLPSRRPLHYPAFEPVSYVSASRHLLWFPTMCSELAGSKFLRESKAVFDAIIPDEGKV